MAPRTPPRPGHPCGEAAAEGNSYPTSSPCLSEAESTLLSAAFDYAVADCSRLIEAHRRGETLEDEWVADLSHGVATLVAANTARVQRGELPLGPPDYHPVDDGEPAALEEVHRIQETRAP